MAAMAMATASGVAFVPSAVVDKAMVHDMLYAGCPRCSTSVGNFGGSAREDAAVALCRACGASFRASELQYKYRLKLQLAFDGELVDAMLFDEAARALLGVPATQLKRALLPRHPALPLVLAGILEGLHVAFHFQRRPQPRDAKYTKDLKIVRLTPLMHELLPRPAVLLALDLLLLGRPQLAPAAADEDVSDLSTQ